MTHPDLSLLLRYQAEDCGESEVEEVDRHLARCRDCLRQVRALGELQSNLNAQQSGWTAAEHGRVYRQWSLAVALKCVATANPALGNRARPYFSRLTEGAGTSLRILMDRERQLAVVAATVLPQGSTLSVQLVRIQRRAMGADGREFTVDSADTLPGLTSELHARFSRCSELLLNNQGEAASQELDAIAKIAPQVFPSVIWEIHHHDQRETQIVVDPNVGKIVVTCWPLPARPRPELALLLPQNSPEAASLAEFESSGESGVMVEFMGLPSGQSEVLW